MGKNMKVLWVLVNCNTFKEASAIGSMVLRKRLIACFDIFPRLAAHYFWPPKSGKVETATGCLLVLETLPGRFKKLSQLVRKHHSDSLPFVGSIEISNVHGEYVRWLRGELRP